MASGRKKSGGVAASLAVAESKSNGASSGGNLSSDSSSSVRPRLFELDTSLVDDFSNVKLPNQYHHRTNRQHIEILMCHIDRTYCIMHTIGHCMCGPAVQHMASKAVDTLQLTRCMATVLALSSICPNEVSQYVLFYALCVGWVV